MGRLNLSPDPSTIEVGENTFAVLDFQLFDDFGAMVDITGDAFQLTVKGVSQAVEVNPPVAPGFPVNFSVNATLVTVTEGKFRFSLTPEHTALIPGDWPAEIKWWASGTTTEPPKERKLAVYRVTGRLTSP